MVGKTNPTHRYLFHNLSLSSCLLLGRGNQVACGRLFIPPPTTYLPPPGTASLDAASLWRPTPVVRDRRTIFNRLHFNSNGRQGAHGGFPAGARPANSHFH